MNTLIPNFKDIRVRNLAVINSFRSSGTFIAENLVLNNLEVQGNIKVNSNNAFKQGGQFWNVLSDRRKKKNITEINNNELVEKFDKIKIYNFQYRDAEDEKKWLGVMADEIEELFPEAVNEVDNYKVVDTSYVFYSMLAKIKSQDAELNIIKNRLAELEKKINK